MSKTMTVERSTFTPSNDGDVQRPVRNGTPKASETSPESAASNRPKPDIAIGWK